MFYPKESRTSDSNCSRWTPGLHHHRHKSGSVLVLGENPKLYEFVSPPKDLCGVTKIAVGDDHACADTASGLRCWGRWMKDSNLPKDLGRIFSMVAKGNDTCAQTESGVRCWWTDGKDNQDYYYDGASGKISVRDLTDVSSLSMGPYGNFACAALRTGEFRCWGDTSSSSNNYLSHWGNFFSGFGKIKMMTNADHNTCFYTDNGTICGNNNFLDPYWQTPLPRPKHYDLGNVTAMSSTWRETCLVTEKREFGCVNNSSDGTDDHLFDGWPNRPTDVNNVMALASGGYFLCAITDGSKVRCWMDTPSGN